MRDYLIRVPEPSQYAAHKTAYEVLDKQERPLYRYEPSMNAVVVRAPFEIEDALPLRSVEWDQDDLLRIELRAAVMGKRNGRRFYLSPADTVYREHWLRKRASAAGFEVESVEITAGRDEVDKPGAAFGLDRTDFRAVVRVTDPSRFQHALNNGIGPTGRAFGRGLILITQNISREQ